MADDAERPTVEGFAAPDGLRWRGHMTDALRGRGGRLSGIRGLPPDEDRFLYQIGFGSLGSPTHAEAIVFVWSDRPTMDELALRHEAVRMMEAMVERGV